MKYKVLRTDTADSLIGVLSEVCKNPNCCLKHMSIGFL